MFLEVKEISVGEGWFESGVGFGDFRRCRPRVVPDALFGEAAPVGTPTQVLDLVVTAGDFDGTLDLAWDPVRGAVSYKIWISLDPVTPTSYAFKKSSSKSSDTITGLTSGVKMWVRVRAIGAGSEPGPWSDPAVKTVP